MSWFAGPVDTFHDTVEADLDSLVATGQEGAHVNVALHAAKKAAVELVRSGAVGWEPVIVMLNGHANPDNKKTEGWANDTITVSVTQI